MVGHTSNIYFKDSFSIENLVTTRKLTNYTIKSDTVICECGVHVSRLAWDMVRRGFKGFEGLIDLPGTIGAAIVNNSGCYGCHVSDLLEVVKVLLPDGQVRNFSSQELSFRLRSSALKRGDIKGVVLSVTLALVKGDANKLRKLAEKAHQDRLLTQPGPRNNLGTTYCSLGERTIYGKFLGIISGIYSKCLKLLGEDLSSRGKNKFELEFILSGGRCVLPYLWSMERFIWKDKKADMIFVRYQKIMRRLYLSPKLEIEIFE